MIFEYHGVHDNERRTAAPVSIVTQIVSFVRKITKSIIRRNMGFIQFFFEKRGNKSRCLPERQALIDIWDRAVTMTPVSQESER